MRKRLISIVLSLLMVVTMIPSLGSVAFAADKPDAPINLRWDGTTAKWDITDSTEITGVYLYVYNKKDTSNYVWPVGTGEWCREYNLSDVMIPGDTYYFEVFVQNSAGQYSDRAVSDEYTVPGSYTIADVSNVKFASNGEVSWSEVPYVTEYKVTLYCKDGTEWIEKNTSNASGWATSHSLNYFIEEGKTYKCAIVAYQGNVQLSNKTESNEITRKVLVALDEPTGINMYGGIFEWQAVENAKNSYNVFVYDEAGGYVTNANGSFNNNGVGICYFDVSKKLTVGQKYYITIKANGDNETYKDSGTVTSDSFEYKGTWSNLKWDGKVARWDAYDGATNYWVSIYKNGYPAFSNGFESDGHGTSFDATEKMAQLGDGNYQFSVVPYINDNWRDEHASDRSAEYAYTAPAATLNAPTGLSWDGDIARWNPVADAKAYSVQLYRSGTPVGQPLDAGAETSINLRMRMEDARGTSYSFKVRSRNGEDTSEWSDMSPEHQYEPIGVPSGLSWNGMVLRWNPVENATSYWLYIYKDDLSILNTGSDTNSYNLRDLMIEKGAGKYRVEVVAGVPFDGTTIYGRGSEKSEAYDFPGKVSVDVSGITWQSPYTRTYTGKQQEIKLSSIPENVKVAISGNKYTKVGTYKAKVTFTSVDSDLYEVNGSVATKTWKIIPKKAAIKSVSVGKGKITVKATTKVSSTGGSVYQIAYKQKGTSKWKTTTTTSYYKTVKKLKKGKRYYVKVRAYKSVSGVKHIGGWSKTVLSKKIK